MLNLLRYTITWIAVSVSALFGGHNAAVISPSPTVVVIVGVASPSVALAPQITRTTVTPSPNHALVRSVPTPASLVQQPLLIPTIPQSPAPDRVTQAIRTYLDNAPSEDNLRSFCYRARKIVTDSTTQILGEDRASLVDAHQTLEQLVPACPLLDREGLSFVKLDKDIFTLPLLKSDTDSIRLDKLQLNQELDESWQSGLGIFSIATARERCRQTNLIGPYMGLYTYGLPWVIPDVMIRGQLGVHEYTGEAIVAPAKMVSINLARTSMRPLPFSFVLHDGIQEIYSDVCAAAHLP